ncbi:hypothetical protein CAPTEDRAFT_90101 [Capitella teleta]|uniref:G-protein coupled receptors family 1 profile domain-containing protein n=1 Tax=Capitella teleta TaxID=283909 RepID=R7VK68_CAPTE|nr:hypothetical protein CAPTEDRAFT_90101 [Capitella teleta]|eukprot:ELU16525.1 hypothetical protein CAPTEDRAFT_90101 [Capitella teleta]
MVYAVIMLTAGVPGNILTIVAYCKCEHLQSPTNLLICNQSIGDLFTCITGPLFVILNYTQAGLVLTSSHRYLCLICLASLLISLESSIFNILALSTERFIAVYIPYHYYSWVTVTRTKRVVISIWSVVVITNCLPIMGWENWTPGVPCMTIYVYPKIFFQFVFVIPCLVCLGACAIENVLIAIMAVKKQRSIAPALPVNHDQLQEEAARKIKRQFKVTKMLLMVVGVFYITWVPYLVLNSILYSMPTSWKDRGVPEWVVILNELCKPLVVVNTITNPFIYGYKNQTFRDAYYKVLGIRNTQIEAEQLPSTARTSD